MEDMKRSLHSGTLSVSIKEESIQRISDWRLAPLYSMRTLISQWIETSHLCIENIDNREDKQIDIEAT
jgi:hypothetical protein